MVDNTVKIPYSSCIGNNTRQNRQMFLQVSPHAGERFQQRLDFNAPRKIQVPKGYIVKRYRHFNTNNEILLVLTMFRGQPAIFVCDKTDRVLLTVVTTGKMMTLAMKTLKEKKCVSQNSGLMN